MLDTLTMIHRMRQQHREGSVNKPGSLGRGTETANGANIAVKGLPTASCSAQPYTGITACPATAGGSACFQRHELPKHHANCMISRNHYLDMRKQQKMSDLDTFN